MAAISVTHPFEIESVVDNVFKYLQLNEIVKQRTVCRLWHKIGTKRLVDRIDEVQIQFGLTWSFDVPDLRKTIDNFLRMQQSSSIKFTNVATYYFESDLKGKIPKAEETTKLFSQYGQHIKQVKLNLSGKNCWRFLSSILTTQAPNMEQLHLNGYPELNRRVIDKKLFPHKKPNLKLKSLILHSQDEFEDPIFNKEFLTDLFECSAYLERLVIGLDEDQIGEDRIQGHESLVLSILASKGNISNLMQLSVNGTEDVFEILADSYQRAPLRKFDASITQIDSTEMLENIQTFLDDHKDTWTDLVLTFPCVDVGEIDFPKMVNLSYLSISEWCMDEEELDESDAPLGTFNFGRQFPNLVTLKLTEDPKTEGRTFFKFDESFTEDAAPVLSLRNLSLPPQFHAAILRRIGRTFPNVIDLELTVQTVEVLKELWITWPEMKHLDITIVPGVSFGSTSLDSIFTGIPDASLKTLQDSRANPVAVKSFQYIGKLKKLSKLLIKGPSHSSSYKVNASFNTGLKVTNETARLALANLKELNFLRISRDRHEISASCVQELCNGLGLQQVKDGGALRLVKYECQKEILVFDW